MGAALPAWAKEASAASTERAPRTTIGTTEAKLRDPAKTSGDDFGYDTAVSGDVAVVGAPERTSNGDGAAYIYVKGSRGWPTKPTTTLADPAATVGNYFGFAVAVSGKTVVVGALNTDDGTGAAYIYTEGHDGWPSSPTVTLADPLATEDDGFGQSVAVFGKTVVVGAFGSHDANGAAYIYSEASGAWPSTPTVDLSDPESGESWFGNGLGMTKDTLVVGADLTGGLAGAAYLYVEGPSTWPTEPTATLQDPMATSGDNFGDDVAISSTSVVIGAEDTSNETGAAYIYSESSGVWPSTPTATLDAPTGSTQFGNSVATSGDETLVTGSSQAGGGYVYTESSSGWPATPTGTLSGNGSGPAFVALKGSTLVEGVYVEKGEAGRASIEKL